MICPSCGIALAPQMKYCNRCGTHISTKEVDVIQIIEKRMDSEMEGLFWITVMGLSLILGGMALMKKLHFSDGLIIAYMILSAAALMAYFGLGVWQVRRLARSLKQTPETDVLTQPDTNELGPVTARTSLGAALSVTENTTRTLEPIPKIDPTAM
jgi:hypothetical protein